MSYAVLSILLIRSGAATSTRLLLIQHFRVDDVVADRLAVEHAQNVLHCGNAHAIDRFAGDPSNMRCSNKIRQGQQRVVLRGWLLVKNIECGTGDAVRLQHIIECLLVDNAATRSVDDEGGAL